MASKVLFKQQHPAHGYEVRTEQIDNPEEGNEPITLLNAYTTSGDYIGDPQTAKYLCEKGIAPKKITPESGICQIGFCENDQKWYGWSPRAIGGFGIGSRIQRGDSGYTPDTVSELADLHAGVFEEIKIVDGRTIMGIIKQYKIIGEKDDGELIYADEPDTSESYSIKTGRGEWTAKTLDDARQMAIDFAKSIA